MSKNNPYNVKVGQVWLDDDPRNLMRRTIRVVCIGLPLLKALVVCDGSFKYTEIRLDRFTPGSRGYRLVKDV